MTCQITTFFHCRKCIEELPRGISPMDYQRIQAGFTQDGKVQVWCNRHDIAVTTINREIVRVN